MNRIFRHSRREIHGNMIRNRESSIFIVCIIILAFVPVLFSSCIEGRDKEESHSKEQAVMTVTSFLEMCKQGRLEEAAQEYLDSVHGRIDILPTFMDKIVDYTVNPSASAVWHWKDIPPARIVMAEVQIKGTENIELSFFCSEGGMRIFLVGYSQDE